VLRQPANGDVDTTNQAGQYLERMATQETGVIDDKPLPTKNDNNFR
jgi:hypothetical protein